VPVGFRRFSTSDVIGIEDHEMCNIRPVLRGLLLRAVELHASDLHLTANSTPWLRLAGELTPLEDPFLNEDECRDLIVSAMTEPQKKHFEHDLGIDFGFGLEGAARFRANIFMQRGLTAAVFRVIPSQIRSLEELRLPPVLAELTRKKRGLVLVTGPSGSGKSTTLASMVDRINRQRKGHIITVEDPIEFLHSHRGCVVSQREVNVDVESFGQALRSILREDPDVVLIGEMRDLETVTSALRIAETGHLTLATLHTNSAHSTISRIIGMFPPHQQDQVRGQLSQVLEGIVCQRLLPLVEGSGCAVATEVMIPTPGIRNLIRDKRDHQIYSLMQTGRNKFGMHTMNQSLVQLLVMRRILYQVALSESPDVSELKEILQLRGMNCAGTEAQKSNRELIGCLFTDSEEEILSEDPS
jgi:twitching motility protein PilT